MSTSKAGVGSTESLAINTATTAAELITVLELDYADVADACENLDGMPAANQATVRSHLRSINEGELNNGWGGSVRDMKAVRHLFENGWPEGTEKVMGMVEELKRTLPTPTSIRRVPVWTDEGDELSYDRLLGGQLDQMWRVPKRRRTVATPTVRLVTEIGGHGGYSSDQLFWCGAGLLITAIILEEAGYRTELCSTELTQWSGGGRGPDQVEASFVTLKHPSEPFRPDVVAFAVSHAAFYRAYQGFALLGHMPFEIYGFGGAPEIEATFKGMVERKQVLPADAFFPRSVTKNQALVRIVRALADVTKEPALIDEAERREREYWAHVQRGGDA